MKYFGLFISSFIIHTLRGETFSYNTI